ncbi:MAG: glutamate-5-semialdehyde dehydrogenase [Omnitrophica bacterium RBG_13_46_9]|nr:MAG: glutamate-5-semialdehyde dehydrogenase [Omnitrophica bacterium RBG_13_46_9]
MDLKNEVKKIAGRAKEASRSLGSLETEIKNAALKEMARALVRSKSYIMKSNGKDLMSARKLRLSAAFMDRLRLTDKHITGMADSLNEVAGLADPVGSIEKLTKRPNGLLIGKMRVPIGVIFVIYESRPNVTADCVGLCLKSGNSLILRGGSEAIHSNIAIFDVLNKAAAKKGLPPNSFSMLRVTDRKAVDILLGLAGVIDLVIPRGGESLIKEVAKKSKIPVIKHYKGVCHTYVDEHADLNIAQSVSYNAKVQRPGVCNAMETLLVHRDVAARFLPPMAKMLIDAGVELRGCPLTRKILRKNGIKAATESDWYAEYLDLILSVKVVNTLEEAIGHINKYGTAHSDAIITEDYDHAMDFLEKVDSSSVYVNASTRFTDGYEFGKGAEIGISTDKLHARGPMGLEELTTYKYVIFGKGQVRK